MGCQPSNENSNNKSTQSEISAEQFKLSYNQFVRKDIGEVFEFYHFSKILNRSSTSLIRKVVHRVTRKQRICKIVPIQKKHNIHIIKEVQILKKMDHPNIVQIQEYFFDKTYLYIIMEYVNGKKLSQFLTSMSTVSIETLLIIYYQLISTLNYCHQKGIAHNLVNPDNILVIEKNKNYFIKLIDFSQAAVQKSPRIMRRNLSKEYKYFKDPYADNSTNVKNDVWSCAILLLFMFSGQKQFDSLLKDKKKVINDILGNLKMQKIMVQSLSYLLEGMLEQSLQDRLSLAEVVSSSVFKTQNTSNPHISHGKNLNQMPITKMLKFKLKTELQSLFWMYTSLNILNTTEKCQYATQFNNLDRNKDGKLDKAQVKEALLNSFKITDEQADFYVNKIFESIDKNHNEYLEYSEFVMATSLISKKVSEEQLHKIFNEIDTNRDGFISQGQLSNIVGSIEGASFLLKERKKLSFSQFKELMFEAFEEAQKVQISEDLQQKFTIEQM